MKDSRLRPNRARVKTGLLGIARCRLHLGQVSEAAEAAEQLNSLCTDDSACRVEIARELALCSVNAKDAAAARRYADRAMDVLRQAGRVSHRDLAALRTDTAFDAIRSHADFDNVPRRHLLPRRPIHTVKISAACGLSVVESRSVSILGESEKVVSAEVGRAGCPKILSIPGQIPTGWVP